MLIYVICCQYPQTHICACRLCIYLRSCVSLCFQLAEAWQEVEVARGRSQQLQAQVEELQEEASLQEGRSYGEASLLSELESSLETVGLGVSKEEVEKHGALDALDVAGLEWITV